MGERICTPDIDLLAVGQRPYYLPHEFSHVVAVVVYIPLSTVAAHACDVIHYTVAELQTKHSRAFIEINHLTHCITDCLRFCEDNVVPTKKIKCFPNNKPWITKEIKTLLNRKNMAFMSGDREEMRSVQGELKKALRRAKNSYKGRLESKLQMNNAKEV